MYELNVNILKFTVLHFLAVIVLNKLEAGLYVGKVWKSTCMYIKIHTCVTDKGLRTNYHICRFTHLTTCANFFSMQAIEPYWQYSHLAFSNGHRLM